MWKFPHVEIGEISPISPGSKFVQKAKQNISQLSMKRLSNCRKGKNCSSPNKILVPVTHLLHHGCKFLM